MDAQKKIINFTGIKIFIGIDIHLNQWIVAIRSIGMELQTVSMNPSPRELYNFLNKNYPHAEYYSVYEAGFCGFWAHRELVQFGIKNIVVNSADVVINTCDTYLLKPPGSKPEKIRRSL